MNAKPLAETALLLWNRMGERPVSEKAAILKTLANWLEVEQIDANQRIAELQKPAMTPVVNDEHYRA